MNLQPIFIREQIIKTVRQFFYDQQFHEVIPPTLNSALPLEPTVYPFETTWQTIHGSKKLYLSTSPESALKKMMAAGIGNCFAFGKSFRNVEDAGDTHIPEFIMLEWYREQATYKDIMKDTEKLIQTILPSLEIPWQQYTMTELFQTYVHVDLETIIDDQEMIAAAKQKGYAVDDATWEQLFNQLFLNEIEPHLGKNPCFVTDFPARISPLCAPKTDNPTFAQRFEIYINGMELGNGNTENTNTTTIREVFEKEQQRRESENHIHQPIDEAFLTALETMKHKSFAGIGLGIDRLAMIVSGAKTITDIEPLSPKY